MEILLISEKYLKTNSYLNDNIGCEFITPAIVTAQELGLQPIIGTNLYDKLKSLVENNSIIQPAFNRYKYLLDEYVTPYLTFKVLGDIQLPLAFKFRNQGIIQDAGDKTINSGLKDVQVLVEYYDNKSKFYANRLSEFLCANRADYPEFGIHKSGGMKASRDAYNTGIFVGHPQNY